MSRQGRHVEIFQGVKGWHWRVVGANGQNMAPSEAYEGRNGKQHAIRAADELHHPLPIYILDDEGNSVLYERDGTYSDAEPDRPEQEGT